jgi:hypothetical protein
MRDRYWVLKAKEHDAAGQPLRPRPYFHWQVFAPFPWATKDEGKNLAKEARQPHKRYNALAKSVALRGAAVR